MALKFYLDLYSQPCRAIVIFNKFNNIKYEQQIVTFRSGDTRSDWYKKINPMGVVPFMDDGGFTLGESQAIIRHLARKYPTAAHWYPTEDLHQAALVDEYLSWQFCPGNLRIAGAMVFIEKALKPFRTGNPVNTDELKARIDSFNPVLDKMENYFLSRGTYIAGGDDVTIADLFAVCELQQPISVGFDVSSGRPKLASWMERVKQRLQPHFDDVHKEIFEFGAKYK